MTISENHEDTFPRLTNNTIEWNMYIVPPMLISF